MNDLPAADPINQNIDAVVAMHAVAERQVDAQAGQEKMLLPASLEDPACISGGSCAKLGTPHKRNRLNSGGI